MNCTIHVAKTKVLISFSVTAQLLCAFVFAYAKIRFSHDAAQIMLQYQYLFLYSDFLESTKDGIEVSYNASGVLAHMLSDGVQAWKVPEPTREEVICRMTLAIKRWPLDSKRNINYR